MNKKRQILIIDDDPLDADLTRRAILKADRNLDIDWFDMADRALEELKNRAQFNSIPAAVFIDLKMPGMSGIEWIKEVRGFLSKAELPVAVFSSSDLNQDKLDSMEAGATIYLVKPTDLKSFRTSIASALDQLLAE